MAEILTIKFIRDWHGTKAGTIYSTGIPQNKQGAMDRVRSGDAVIVDGANDEEREAERQAMLAGMLPDPPKKRGRPPKPRVK